MGFFSWDCEVCGHPLLSAYAQTERNGWMGDVVALESDGSIFKGEYDGYGRVDDEELSDPQVYHHACWKLAGRPDEYREPSESSRDQGYFFDNAAHDFDKPKSLEDCKRIRSVAELNAKYTDLVWQNVLNQSLLGNLQALLVDLREALPEAFQKLPQHTELHERYLSVTEALNLTMERIDRENEKAREALIAERRVELRELGFTPEEIEARVKKELSY